MFNPVIIGNATLYNDDCINILRSLPANSIEACLTDPPYGLSAHSEADIRKCMAAWLADEPYVHGGKGFMQKAWDSFVPGPEMWRELYRVLKPGAHLLVFAGTRTADLMSLALRLAGFECRDQIQWCFGVGFAKGLDVSKAIDAMKGADREVVGLNGNGRPNRVGKFSHSLAQCQTEGGTITAPATPETAQWDGWKSALKPAYEFVICARKPLGLQGVCGILAQKIGESICQLKSLVNVAESRLSSTITDSINANLDSAVWNVAEKCNSPEGLSALMDMWRSGLEIPSSLNTALLWLNTLDAISQHESMFTTEMKSSLITDLKILNSLPSKTIAEAIIAVETGQHGTELNASLVDSIFTAVAGKLNYTLTPSVQESAISQEEETNLPPNVSPILLFRKPLDGTIAGNTLKWGTGGLNVGATRVASGADYLELNVTQGAQDRIYGGGRGLRDTPSKFTPAQGRYPANLIISNPENQYELMDNITSSQLHKLAEWLDENA